MGTTVLSGCRATSDSSPRAKTVTDDLGRTVTLERRIERTVTLAPNLTEIVVAAGAGSTLVGVTSADDYPPPVDTLPRFSALPLDFEAITKLDPDLVLATDQVNSSRDAATFDELGIPIYFFSFSTVDDIIGAIRTTGDLIGTAAAAQSTADSLTAALGTLRHHTGSIPGSERPRVLFLIGDDTLYAFGQNSYVHTLIELAGGRSITDSMATTAPTLSEEFVLTEKPDVIIGAFGADYDPDRLLELHPTWDIVPAIQHGRVYSLNPDWVLRPGPRIVQGARRMAHMLHPSRFGAPAATSLEAP